MKKRKEKNKEKKKTRRLQARSIKQTINQSIIASHIEVYPSSPGLCPFSFIPAWEWRTSSSIPARSQWQRARSPSMSSQFLVQVDRLG